MNKIIIKQWDDETKEFNTVINHPYKKMINTDMSGEGDITIYVD